MFFYSFDETQTLANGEKILQYHSTKMKLDKSVLFDVAQRLKDSKAILDRTHQRISQSLDGLVSVHDIAAKASHILRESKQEFNDPLGRSTAGNQDLSF